MAESPAGPSRGAIGGASGDAGVEFRRAVAAYGAACGLAGVPLPGLDLVAADSMVKAISLETDAEVDDIRFEFTSGLIADVQAKRTLRKGHVFASAVEQWARAGQGDLDPRRHRLVVAAGRLSGPMRALRSALDRRRLHAPGAYTDVEREMLTYLEGLLSHLTQEQRTRVLDAAVIWELPVEEPGDAGAREAQAHLNNAGIGLAPAAAGDAWTRLCAAAGRLARRRGGYDLAGWLNELRGLEVEVAPTTSTPAGLLEAHRSAVERYATRLVRQASELDLRALGAELPPLRLDAADAGVEVSIDPDDRRNRSDLIWAFLRRHRVVLTGLPGAGKTTALRRATGQLAQRLLEEVSGDQPGDPCYPFPVLVSLKQVNALGEERSFRDRLIAAATRDDPASDRPALASEIERRLAQGLPIALLLDALDETYDDRAKVVGEVQSFLNALPDSACVLIATRDVAYGQAATLGWEDLRLIAPDHVDAMVTAVLEAAAAHLNVPDTERTTWRRARKRWVEDVLAKDAALRETPLIPTLLTLLAIERSPEQLPTHRAQVLEAVVLDVMQRHEEPRHRGRPLRNLSGTSLGTSAMHAFATEASVLLDSKGVATIEQVISAVSDLFVDEWALAPAPAREAALGAVRFLDETGLFIMSETSQTVTARLSLFAEVGDAIHAIQHPDSADRWVEQRVADRQLEPVILAAALDDAIAHALEHQLLRRPGDIDLARAMVRAHTDGTRFDETTLTRIRSELLSSIERGDGSGWSDWRELLRLGVPADLVDETIEAASQHSAQHRLLAEATLSLVQQKAGGARAADSVLLDVLAVNNLPRSANDPSVRKGLVGLVIDTRLGGTQVDAASELLKRGVAGAIEAIKERALESSSGVSDGLVQALRQAGHPDVARAIETERLTQLTSGTFAEALRKTDGIDRYPRFLKLVSAASRATLSTRQSIELSELGDFLETLDMNNMRVITLYKQSEEFLHRLIDLTCSLYGFDRGVIAAQAQVVLDRLERDPAHATYFSLFDTARAHAEPDWTMVEDPVAAATLLCEMMRMTASQARFAALSLWESQEAAPTAAPILRQLVHDFAGYPQFQFLAAVALGSLPGVGDAEGWRASPDPSLRRAAACLTEPVEEGHLSETFRPLLYDDDAAVRVEALQQLDEEDFPGRQALLEELAGQDAVGWKCSRCGTDNAPGSTSCSKDGCHIASPRPARKARELLDQRRTPPSP